MIIMQSYAVATGLLFIALCLPSLAQKAEEVVVRVAAGAPLTVECPLRVEQRAEWRRDGAALPADLRPAGEAPRAGRLAARLAAASARPAHAGLYTCEPEPAAHRVRVLVLPAEASAVAATAPTTEAGAGGEDGEAALLFKFDVGRFFALNCTPDTAVSVNYSWRKNGTAVEELPDLKDRYKLEEGGAVFRLGGRTFEDDYGSYACLADGATARAWRVEARPVARLPENSNVVEGQKLKLTCKVIGKPHPAVTWTYAIDKDANETDVATALDGRAVVGPSAAGVAGAELVVEAAARADAGVYRCVPAGGAEAATVLRVKDMYAALWPFLGICAEVLVLCAIILLYERRRTKPELDDSDTDNHEQ